MKYLTMEKTKDGIAIVTIDCPESKVNKVSSGLLDEVAGILRDIQNDEHQGHGYREWQRRQLCCRCGY
jgi:enoyl-CoA hydratase/carnithine racemase